MTPVAAYLRISEPRAVERWSLPAQRDAIAAHCARLGWGEPAWFVEEGRSAISDDYARRPQFRALLAAAEARQFRTVVVVDVDRFARSTLAGLAAAARLERAGCAVVSLNQGDMDLTTPDGEMKFTMHLMVARYESRQKGRRVRASSTSPAPPSGLSELANGTQPGCGPRKVGRQYWGVTWASFEVGAAQPVLTS